MIAPDLLIVHELGDDHVVALDVGNDILLGNGLLPLSERAKEIMHKRFGESADFYIGLDSAILLGDPEVVTVGIPFIPITLLITIVMPGNQVLAR